MVIFSRAIKKKKVLLFVDNVGIFRYLSSYVVARRVQTEVDHKNIKKKVQRPPPRISCLQFEEVHITHKNIAHDVYYTTGKGLICGL